VAKTWKTILIYHIHDHELQRCARCYLSGRLLDIGCGAKPYKEMLSSYVSEHIGLDRPQPFNPRAEIDLIGTAYEIPVENRYFDSALCTAALEHLAEPEIALRECNRVLKKGGVAVYTVPLLWQLHSEPWDYYRFTKYGLRHIFEKVGFEILEINALGGYWVTTSTMFCYYLERFEGRWMRRIKIIRAIGIASQALAYLLEKADKAESWTWMYSVVAVKR